jgi:hypothetical protein
MKVKKSDSSTCLKLGIFRIRIWIGIKIESRIMIRIIIKMMPIHNTVYVNVLNFHNLLLAVLPAKSDSCRYSLRNKKSDRVSVSVADPG